MCIVINRGKLGAPLQAEVNIPAYKELEKHGISEHQGFQYLKGKLNQEDIRFEHRPASVFDGLDEANMVVLYKGFHSRIVRTIQDPFTKNSLFVIPKGALYMTGMENSDDWTHSVHNNYLSNQIIYVGKNNRLNRLLAKWKYGVEFK